MKAEAHPADECAPATGAADELAEVVAGDVLDDLATGVDDRAVRQHERDAEKRSEFRNVAQGVPEIVMTPDEGIVVVKVWPARIVCTAPTAPGCAAVEKLT